MSSEAQFLKDNRVILYTYSDPLDLSKDTQILVEHRQLYENAALPIHRIIDATHITKIPSGLLSAVLHNTNLRHPKSGSIVLIIQHPMFSILADVVRRAIRSADVRVVHSMDEASAEIDRILAKETSQSSV